MSYMLEIQNIHKTFNAGTINEKIALNGVNLNLNPGDFVTIIGGNGAGKSTTLNAIAGVWGVDQGKIIIDGVDITKLSEHKRAKFLGRVFQDPSKGTCPSMTILENLAIADNKGKAYGLGRGTNHARMDAYRELLASVGLGLEDKMHTKVGALSGGQRQTLALLMATMKPIEFLILDEHTAALDPKKRLIPNSTYSSGKIRHNTAPLALHRTRKIPCASKERRYFRDTIICFARRIRNHAI